jgi:hypothetical protein
MLAQQNLQNSDDRSRAKLTAFHHARVGVGGIHRRPLRNNTGMIGPVWRPQLLITPARGSCRAVCTPGSRKASWPEIVQGPLAFRVYCVPTRNERRCIVFPVQDFVLYI